jgi:hypothetical protein
VALEQKRTGRFEEVRARLAAQQRAAEGGPSPMVDVVAWYQRHVRLVGENLTTHARELGLRDAVALLAEMTDQYRAATRGLPLPAVG